MPWSHLLSGRGRGGATRCAPEGGRTGGRSMSVRRRLERIEHAYYQRWLQAVDAVIPTLTDRELALLIAGLEADLAGRPVTPEQDQALERVARRIAEAMGSDAEAGEG